MAVSGRLPPLFPTLLFYALGLFAGEYSSRLPGYSTSIFPILIGLPPFTLAWRRGRWRRYLLLLPLLFLSGMTAGMMEKGARSPPIPPIPEGVFIFSGFTLSPSEPYRQGVRFDMQTTSFFEEFGRPGRPITLRVRALIENCPEGVFLDKGERIAVRGRLRIPRNFNTPGSFDLKRWAERESISATIFLRGPGSLAISGKGRRGPGMVTGMKRRITEFILGNSPPPSRDVLAALTAGIRGTTPPEIREEFSRLGVSHILAISGLHVGILFVASNFLIKQALLPLPLLRAGTNLIRLSGVLSILPVVFYSSLSGFQVSTRRALIMIVLHISGQALGRRLPLLHNLFLAGLMILIVSPSQLFEISFILSFSSVLSIALLSPLLKGAMKGEGYAGKGKKGGLIPAAGEFLLDIALASLSVFFGLFPILLGLSTAISPLFILANILAIPLLGFTVVPLALLSSLLFIAGSGLAPLLLRIASTLVGLTLTSLHEIASLFETLSITGKPSWPDLIVYYTLFLGALLFISRRRPSRPGLALWLLFIPPASQLIPSIPFEEKGRIYLLDTGQGDASFIETPGGRNILIDTGLKYGHFDCGRSVVTPFLRWKRVKKLDYIAISHFHRDHYGGLGYILNNFRVVEVWIPPCHEEWGRREGVNIAGGSARVKRVEEGHTLSLKEGVSLEVLHPSRRFCRELLEREEARGEGRTENDSSLYIMLSIFGRRFLFPGDGEEMAEAETFGRLERADFVKVPHHGSRSSSSPPFVKALSPKIVFFPVGYENRYNFPSPLVAMRYKSSGAVALRADLHGTLEITVTEKTLRARTFTLGEGWRGVPLSR